MTIERMTNKEAIDYIEKWETDYSVDAKDREVLSMAIKAIEQQNKSEIPTGLDPCDGCRYELNSTNGNPCYSCGKYKLTEQQPCEDAISRQAVLDTEYQIKEINGIEYVMLSEVQMKVRKMSPVTPTYDLEEY